MIGVFGGTFDPVHYGHIKPAMHVLDALKLERLLFIPNRVPPHRQAPCLSVQQRLALLQTVTAALGDRVALDCRELDRDGPSYMVDTLASLHQDYPEKTLGLIIGMDAFAGIDHWHNWQALFDYASIIVTQRPGYDAADTLSGFSAETGALLKEKLVTLAAGDRFDSAGRILLQSVPQVDVSSTMIRQCLKAGEDISKFVPADIVAELGTMFQSK